MGLLKLSGKPLPIGPSKFLFGKTNFKKQNYKIGAVVYVCIKAEATKMKRLRMAIANRWGGVGWGGISHSVFNFNSRSLFYFF